MRRFVGFVILLPFLWGFDLGGFVGQASNNRGGTYGVFASLSFFPFTRVEIEGSKFFGRSEKQISLNGEVGIGLGGIHPYFSLGVGIDTGDSEKLTLSRITSTSFFTSTGAGVKFNISPMLLKMRIDVRRFSLGEKPYYRAYIGLFFSI